MNPQISVVLTCHNRKSKTIACLQSILAQKVDATLSCFLVDDASTDGTAEAVSKLWPTACIIRGTGNLFWCGGMRVAWKQASSEDPDYYFLVNDDTVLLTDALQELLSLVPDPQSSRIGVGAICDPRTNQWTYGGLQSNHPFPRFPPSPRLCRTLNMNAALVPRSVFQRLGVLHRAYRHAMGDMDYGLRATEQGIEILETTTFIGQCPTNSPKGTWRDKTLGRAIRFKKVLHPKGLPPVDWFVYTRRNCGIHWLQYFFSPYFRILFKK